MVPTRDYGRGSLCEYLNELPLRIHPEFYSWSRSSLWGSARYSLWKFLQGFSLGIPLRVLFWISWIIFGNTFNVSLWVFSPGTSQRAPSRNSSTSSLWVLLYEFPQRISPSGSSWNSSSSSLWGLLHKLPLRIPPGFSFEDSSKGSL